MAKEIDINVFRLAGELYCRMQQILVPGELKMSFDLENGFLFEWQVRIVNRQCAASFNVIPEELFLHNDLSAIAERVARPWINKYCEAVHKESYKEH